MLATGDSGNIVTVGCPGGLFATTSGPKVAGSPAMRKSTGVTVTVIASPFARVVVVEPSGLVVVAAVVVEETPRTKTIPKLPRKIAKPPRIQTRKPPSKTKRKKKARSNNKEEGAAEADAASRLLRARDEALPPQNPANSGRCCPVHPGQHGQARTRADESHASDAPDTLDELHEIYSTPRPSSSRAAGSRAPQARG